MVDGVLGWRTLDRMPQGRVQDDTIQPHRGVQKLRKQPGEGARPAHGPTAEAHGPAAERRRGGGRRVPPLKNW